MPELRQDQTTKEWVVIAVERARRPDQFRDRAATRLPASHDHSSCPFCPGNENLTPPEVFALRESEHADQPGWLVRGVPNKFAALTSDGNALRPDQNLFFNTREGFGDHEVIIETPLHDRPLPLMSEGEIADVQTRQVAEKIQVAAQSLEAKGKADGITNEEIRAVLKAQAAKLEAIEASLNRRFHLALGYVRAKRIEEESKGCVHAG